MSDERHRHRTVSPAAEREITEALSGWASALRDSARVRRFMNTLAEVLTERGEPFKLSLGKVAMRGDDGKWSHEFGLGNISQTCAAAPEARWPDLISQHFDLLQRGMERDRAADKPLAEVRDNLVLRLWEAEEIEQSGADLVSRRDIPGLATVLAIDLPESLMTVRAATAQGWGVDPLSLFDLALDHALELSPATTEQIDIDDGEPLWLLDNASIYTASHALRLAAKPELLGRRGAIVGMPTRHVVIGARFDSVAVAGSINALISIVRGAHRDGPGSLTPRLYWFEPGRWLEIPYKVGRKEIQVHPPDELVEALNAVAEE